MLGFSEPYGADRCCLCGSGQDLTGEHKIKGSTIRLLFTGEPMMIGHFDGSSRPKLAQSAQSKAFHFGARMCGTCNSTRTQAPDREFERFDAAARDLLERGVDPSTVFDDPHYAVGTEPYLNVFRYLAKILACQIAEVEGPRLKVLTEFALGRSNRNVVRLSIDEDPAYRMWHDATGDPHFAGHGGLMVEFSRRTGLAREFASSLTHGPVRYWFSIAFGPAVAIALRLLHPEFHGRLKAAFDEALAEHASAARG